MAQLVKGDSLYVPRAELAASDLLSIDQTQRMQARLVNFLAAHIEAVLGRLTILATPDLASQTPPKTSPSKASEPKDSSPKDAPVQDTAA